MLPIEDQKILKKMLTRQEGRRNFIYRDTKNNETVGIGHLCSNGFSDDIIDLIYEEDWQTAYNFLLKSFSWFKKLDSVRKIALISMVFNLGSNNFLKFKDTIEFLDNSDYQSAAKAMRSSLWANQVPHRVKELSAIIETGVMTTGG